MINEQSCKTISKTRGNTIPAAVYKFLPNMSRTGTTHLHPLVFLHVVLYNVLIRAEWAGGFVCFHFSIISVQYVLTAEILFHWLFSSFTLGALTQKTIAMTTVHLARWPLPYIWQKCEYIKLGTSTTYKVVITSEVYRYLFSKYILYTLKHAMDTHNCMFHFLIRVVFCF